MMTWHQQAFDRYSASKVPGSWAVIDDKLSPNPAIKLTIATRQSFCKVH